VSTAQDTGKAMGPLPHIDLAWKIHEYIQNYIRFADTKAAFVVAWVTGFLSVLYIGKLHHHFVASRFNLSEMSLLPTASATSFILLVAAFVSAAWAILPRLPTKQLGGYVFWESILVHATAELYAKSFSRETPDALLEHVCIQVYTVAGVARRKYLLVTLSMVLALLGSFSGAVVIILAS
jgi:hypothetical protein